MCYYFKDIENLHFSEDGAIGTVAALLKEENEECKNAHFSLIKLVIDNEELCNYATDGDIFVACNYVYEKLKDIVDDKMAIEIAKRLFLDQGAMNIRLSLQSRAN